MFLKFPQIQRDALHQNSCLLPQIKLSASVIKRNVAEMGKPDAVVTIDSNLCRRLDQRVCILLVWKRAERPGKYRNAILGGLV